MPNDDAVIDLQVRFAYQEEALQVLSETVARQQREIDALQLALRTLAERIARFGEGGGPAPTLAEERPPHY